MLNCSLKQPWTQSWSFNGFTAVTYKFFQYHPFHDPWLSYVIMETSMSQCVASESLSFIASVKHASKWHVGVTWQKKVFTPHVISWWQTPSITQMVNHHSEFRVQNLVFLSLGCEILHKKKIILICFYTKHHKGEAKHPPRIYITQMLQPKTSKNVVGKIMQWGVAKYCGMY